MTVSHVPKNKEVKIMSESPNDSSESPNEDIGNKYKKKTIQKSRLTNGNSPEEWRSDANRRFR